MPLSFRSTRDAWLAAVFKRRNLPSPRNERNEGRRVNRSSNLLFITTSRKIVAEEM